MNLLIEIEFDISTHSSQVQFFATSHGFLTPKWWWLSKGNGTPESSGKSPRGSWPAEALGAVGSR